MSHLLRIIHKFCFLYSMQLYSTVGKKHKQTKKETLLPESKVVVESDNCKISSFRRCLRETWWKGNDACNSVSQFGLILDSIYQSFASWNFNMEKYKMAIMLWSTSLKCETDSVSQWWLHIWWVKGDRKNPCPLDVPVVSIEMGEVRR